MRRCVVVVVALLASCGAKQDMPKEWGFLGTRHLSILTQVAMNRSYTMKMVPRSGKLGRCSMAVGVEEPEGVETVIYKEASTCEEAARQVLEALPK